MSVWTRVGEEPAVDWVGLTTIGGVVPGHSGVRWLIGRADRLNDEPRAEPEARSLNASDGSRWSVHYAPVGRKPKAAAAMSSTCSSLLWISTCLRHPLNLVDPPILTHPPCAV